MRNLKQFIFQATGTQDESGESSANTKKLFTSQFWLNDTILWNNDGLESVAQYILTDIDWVVNGCLWMRYNETFDPLLGLIVKHFAFKLYCS